MINPPTVQISATTLPGLGLCDILQSLFPCASITGAPKISTMKIIAELEPEPRVSYSAGV